MYRNTFLFTIFFGLLLSCLVFAQKEDINLAAKSIREAGINHLPITLEANLTDYLNEGFEGGVVPPSGWTAVIQNPAYTWKISTTSFYAGLYGADVEYDPALVPQNEWLVSPSLDLSSVTGALILNFYWNTSYYWFVDPYNNGDVFMKISSDGGSTWTTLWSEDSVGVFTNWTWYAQELDISSYGGQSNVKIALNYVGVDAAQFVADEISLYSLAGPGQATNPNPPDGATGIPINGNIATWTNPTGATSCDVWFGPAGNMTQVHTGSLISQIALPALDYYSVYNWRVDEIDGTGLTTGPLWSFTTVQDPNIVTLFSEDFESGLGNWTITNLGGTCDWNVWDATTWESFALPELPGGTAGHWLGANSDGCGSGTTMQSEIEMNFDIDCSQYQTVTLSYDSDFRIYATDLGMLDISVDGGNTWTNLRTLQGVSVRNEQVLYFDISMYAALQSTVRLKMYYYGAYDYWWCLDNMIIEGSDIVPVELTSFTAIANFGEVELSWITATETNNQGFEVQRSSGNAYETIAFVDGHGTTTEPQAYSYSDRSVNSGSYSYRLKQVDFDGSFEYSSVIEVEVPVLREFGLDQNYPNPFNPSTKITFQLAVDSKVSLKVFDVLGQEVVTLVNTNLVAGSHNVNFDASSLNSGVYLYRIETTGIDGSNFVDVKKMILTK